MKLQRVQNARVVSSTRRTEHIRAALTTWNSLPHLIHVADSFGRVIFTHLHFINPPRDRPHQRFDASSDIFNNNDDISSIPAVIIIVIYLLLLLLLQNSGYTKN